MKLNHYYQLVCLCHQLVTVGCIMPYAVMKVNVDHHHALVLTNKGFQKVSILLSDL